MSVQRIGGQTSNCYNSSVNHLNIDFIIIICYDTVTTIRSVMADTAVKLHCTAQALSGDILLISMGVLQQLHWKMNNIEVSGKATLSI